MSSINWLDATITSMQAASVTLLLLSTSVCAALLFGGRRRRSQVLSQRQGQADSAPSGRAMSAPAQLPQKADLLDVDAELRVLMHELLPQAACQLATLEIAARPGVLVGVDRATLHTMLRAVIAHAIGQAPCGCVLVTARANGGRAVIVVTDDGQPKDLAVQQATLRAAESLAALQGGRLDVDVRPGLGTTVTVSLPEAVPGRSSLPAPMPIGAAPAPAAAVTAGQPSPTRHRVMAGSAAQPQASER